MKLSDLQIGQKAVIDSVEPFQNKSALAELGFLKGAHVQLMMRAPLGDPLAIRILGSVVAIRRSEADRILIDKISD